MAAPAIEGRGQDLNLSLPRKPLRVEGDATRLTQVIFNLLNNAAKYTDPGGKVWLTVEREGEWAVVRARDNGTGLKADLVPRVFDLFTQGGAHAGPLAGRPRPGPDAGEAARGDARRRPAAKGPARAASSPCGCRPCPPRPTGHRPPGLRARRRPRRRWAGPWWWTTSPASPRPSCGCSRVSHARSRWPTAAPRRSSWRATGGRS